MLYCKCPIESPENAMASFSKYTKLQKQIWPEFRVQSKNLKQKEEIYDVIQKT